MHNARRWDQHVVPKRTSNVRNLMCQKSEDLKEKNLQNSPVQRYIKPRPLDLFFRSQLQKIVRPLMGYVIVLNSVTTVRPLNDFFYLFTLNFLKCYDSFTNKCTFYLTHSLPAI